MKILLDLQSQSEQIDILENEELSFDHAELGARLLMKWNLSDFHVEVTQFHHKAHRAPNYSYEASIIHFSDILANTMQLGSSGEKPVSSELEEKTWEGLRLTDNVSLADLKEKVHETYDETVSLFLQTT